MGERKNAWGFKDLGAWGINCHPLLVRFNPEHGAGQVREHSPRGNLSIAYAYSRTSPSFLEALAQRRIPQQGSPSLFQFRGGGSPMRNFCKKF